MPTLLLHYPEKEKRWKVEVQKDRFTVGRSREVDVCIPHTSVSKKHLAIEKRGPRFFFRDLGSKNGIYWNDFRRESGSLTDGDELRLGSIVITFYRKEAPPQLPAAASSGSRSLDEDLAGSSTVGPRTASRERLEADPAPAEDPTRTMSPREADPSEDDALLADLPASLADVVLQGAEAPPSLAEESAAPPPEPPAAAEDATAAEGPPPGSRGLSAEAARPASRRGPARTPGRGPGAARPARPAAEPTPEAGAPARRSPSPTFLLAAAGCLGLGVLLGYVALLIERRGAQAPVTPTESAGAPAAGSAVPVPAPTTTAAPAAPGASTLAKAVEEPLGPPARFEDLETRRRLAVRLHLDLTGRPPTRDEYARLLAQPDLQALWYEIASRGGSRELRARGVEALFPRFLGREAQAGEKAALLALAGSDLDQLAFLIGTSSAYANAQHRRKRTDLLLARSLITDLLGTPPGAEAAAKAAEGLRANPDGLAAIARAIASAAESKAGPRSGEALESWIEETYTRLLLRQPTTAEKEKVLDDLKAAAEAWREELLELVARAEYRMY
jgi:hypothetical protein